MEFVLEKPLNVLEAYEAKSNNEEIVLLIRKVRSPLNATKLDFVALNLQTLLVQKNVDRYSEKVPYYNFLIGYVLSSLDRIEEAMHYVQRATTHFDHSGKMHQKAIGYWSLGLLLYCLGKLEEAKIEINRAIKTASVLDQKLLHWGIYDEGYKNMIADISASAAKFGDRRQNRLNQALTKIASVKKTSCQRQPL